jgi:arylsulfatase A-like enzyme
VPLMKGREDGKDRYALSENFRGSAAGRMIRSGQWKYCYFKDDREQLFNLHDDPEEVVNLAAAKEHKDVFESLKSRALKDWNYQDNMQKYKRKASENRKAGIKDEP